MKNLLNILLVEDSENDALLLIRHIQRGGYEVLFERVVDGEAMRESLQRKPWDIVIADYALPAFNGLAALELLKETKIDIPFIIVSGTIGEDVAVQAMKAGAHDYVMKGNLTRLLPAIQREMDEAEIRRERRRTEEALRESEDRYSGLFEGSKDAIYFSTAGGEFIDINPAGIELFGYNSKEELLAADVNQENFIDSHKYQQKNELIRANGFVKDFEYTLNRKDGSSAMVLDTTLPVRDLQNNVIMYRSILRDVTTQKQLELEFIQAQKMESIGTLAGGVAHDFNNLLGIILGYSSLLEEKRIKPQEFSESVSAIVQAVERGASLVQQILTFARKTHVSFRQIDLAGVARDMLAMLKETFPKIIILNGDFAGNIPDIHADDTQIHQVLLNLCINARDAMPDGGVLTLKTEIRTGEEIREHFPSADQDKYVCLSVIDTGEGMDEETCLKIFDPFFTTKKAGKGTGLGLSVVYGVMQAHHGFIDVQSKQNQGTTFQLFFPASKTDSRRVDLSPQKVVTNLEGKETILFVEDESSIRQVILYTFGLRGYKVFTAQDGISAIQLYEEHKQEIDLVITDLGLPGMTGIDVFKKLKGLNPEVKIIITSGFLEQDIMNILLVAGAKAFIQKPYQPISVLQTVREVLDKKDS